MEYGNRIEVTTPIKTTAVPPTEPAMPPVRPELREAQVVRLEPGDVVVFVTDLTLTPQDVNRIHATMDRAFPDNRNMVLSKAELQVLRASKGGA